MRWFVLSGILISAFGVAATVWATDQASPSFQNDDSTFVPSVFDVTSGQFKITGSFEPIVGRSNSPTYKLYHGVSLKEVVEVVVPPAAGGGGGGGGGGFPSVVTSTTRVNFSGRAYPLSRVTILKDGQIAASSIAGPDAKFEISLSGLSSGTYAFIVYGEDNKGRRSSLFSFPVTATPGTQTSISGIFLSPTIDLDKDQVRRGENIAIFGQSVPNGPVTIVVHSDQTIIGKANTDNNGVYLYNLDTAPLELGTHNAQSKILLASNEASHLSPTVHFEVALNSKPKPIPSACRKADLNCDGKVNLVDFSIASFWYKRALSSTFAQIEIERLNGDKKITLIDFSIMAYYWTG